MVAREKVLRVIEEREGHYVFVPFRDQGVTAAFSTRKRNLRFDPVDREPKNEGMLDKQFLKEQARFCKDLNIPQEDLVYFEQVHGTETITIDESFKGYGKRKRIEDLIKADAALTKMPQTAIAVFTADCAPLFFFDSVKRVIGLAHVGWRGAFSRLIPKMVEKFRSQFNSKPEDLMVAVGPLIRSCCYEVGTEFREKFSSHVQERKNKLYLDLAGFIHAELASAQVSSQNIFDCSFCTSCEVNRFFSYRRDGSGTGRMCSVVMLTR